MPMNLEFTLWTLKFFYRLGMTQSRLPTGAVTKTQTPKTFLWLGKGQMMARWSGKELLISNLYFIGLAYQA